MIDLSLKFHSYDGECHTIAKLDPLHWHKYTRRMISEGFVPEELEVESITPTYDMLKGITKVKLSDWREPYGLCPRPFCSHL